MKVKLILAVSTLLLAVPVVVLAVNAVEAKIRFEEVGAKAGVKVLHHTRKFKGVDGDVLGMFTSGGSSAAVGDYDGDGFDDIYVTDSDEGNRSHLFHNNGNGTFTDVAEKLRGFFLLLPDPASLQAILRAVRVA